MRGKDLEILIVEDSITMTIQLNEFLKKLGYSQITQTDGGAAAISLLEKKAYPLIICDWNMEKVSGLDVLDYTRKNPLNQKSTFIMITAEGDATRITEAVQKGTDGYLIKPITLEQLSQEIEKALKKRKKKK